MIQDTNLFSRGFSELSTNILYELTGIECLVVYREVYLIFEGYEGWSARDISYAFIAAPFNTGRISNSVQLFINMFEAYNISLNYNTLSHLLYSKPGNIYTIFILINCNLGTVYLIS